MTTPSEMDAAYNRALFNTCSKVNSMYNTFLYCYPVKKGEKYYVAMRYAKDHYSVIYSVLAHEQFALFNGGILVEGECWMN